MWINVKKYCEITKLNKSVVYRKINQGVLQTKKDVNGHTLIFLKVETDSFKNETTYIENNSENTDDKQILGSFILEYKKKTDEFINRLTDAHVRELANLKETYEKLIIEKNERINDKEAEIKRLRSENEKFTNMKKKSLFDLW